MLSLLASQVDRITGVRHCAWLSITSSHMYKMYFDHIHPHYPLLSYLPFWLSPFFSQIVPLLTFMSFLKI
jgi:hypothetical protein